jgi:preprotein translocase subunit SecD
MLDFPRWKVWSIVLTLVAGVIFAIPSLMPEATAARLGLGGFPRINLGLDLSGGSHILLEADTKDLSRQNLARMEETVRTEMRRADPRIEIGDISTAGGRLSFMLRDISQLDAAVGRGNATGTCAWSIRPGW